MQLAQGGIGSDPVADPDLQNISHGIIQLILQGKPAGAHRLRRHAQRGGIHGLNRAFQPAAGGPHIRSLRQQADRLAEEGKTSLFFEEDGSLLGVIAVADTVRPDSAEGIRQLKGQGLRVVMLTGDNEKTAKAIAARAGIDEWIAGVLPDEKEAVIRKLQAYGRTAMVGDGINDAPALTRADTGIAIGAGTDVAVDSADIVLMNSSLADVAAAIRLSRGTLRNIHENLFWAFFYNIVCIPLAAGLFGWKMSPMIGAAAMSLSSFTVCMNALRLNLFRLRDTAKDKPLKAANIPLTITEEIRGEREKERKKTMTKTVKIKGMMCGHCEATVKRRWKPCPLWRKPW